MFGGFCRTPLANKSTRYKWKPIPGFVGFTWWPSWSLEHCLPYYVVTPFRCLSYIYEIYYRDFIYIHICMCVHTYIHRYVYLHINMSVYMCLSIHPPIHPFETLYSRFPYNFANFVLVVSPHVPSSTPHPSLFNSLILVSLCLCKYYILFPFPWEIIFSS